MGFGQLARLGQGSLRSPFPSLGTVFSFCHWFTLLHNFYFFSQRPSLPCTELLSITRAHFTSIIPRMFTLCLDALNQVCALQGPLRFHGGAVRKINPNKSHSEMIFFPEQPMLVLYHLHCMATPTM